MPSLLRAYELCTRAATAGFDWVRPADVLDKLDEATPPRIDSTCVN